MALVTVTFTSAVVLSGLTAVACLALCFGKPVATFLFGQEEDVAVLVGEVRDLHMPCDRGIKMHC